MNVDWEHQYTSIIGPCGFDTIDNIGEDFFFEKNPFTNQLLTPPSPYQLLPRRDSLAVSPSFLFSPASSRSSSISGPSVDMQGVPTFSLDQLETSQLYPVQLQQATPSPNGGNVMLPEDAKDPSISQTLKANGKPKRPMNAYFIFMKEYRPKLGAMHPDKNTGEISGMLSQMWKDMSSKDREVYKVKHTKLMAKFNQDFPNYQYERSANGTRRHGSRGGKGALRHATSMNFQYARTASNPYPQQQHQIRYETPVTPPEYYHAEQFPSTSYHHYEVPQEYHPRSMSQSYTHMPVLSPQPRRIASQSFSSPVHYRSPYASHSVYSSPPGPSPHLDRRASYHDIRMYPTQLS